MKKILFYMIINLTVMANFLNDAKIGLGVPYEVEQMTRKGLDFLVSNQSFNGTWNVGSTYDKQNGVLGLAILAMLSTGEDPNYGLYKKQINRSLKYLLRQQDDKGFFGSSMYHHGFATLALAECYGVIKNSLIGPALQKAIKLLIDSQQNNPKKAWRYSVSATSADTTVSGACAVALFAAKNAGIEVPDKPFTQLLNYYKNCQNKNGGFGYTNSNGPAVERTVIGNLISSLARINKNEDLFQKSYNYMFQNKENSRRNYYFYYIYYGSQAYFQADIKEWRIWNKELITKLRQKQNNDGSWNDGSHGKVFSTSAAILSMALNYRFLPIYERE